MVIKKCSKGSIPIVKRLLGENFQTPVKNGPQNGDNSKKLGLDMTFYVRDPEKAHPCGTACFGVFFVKICPGPLAVVARTPQKTNVLVR